MGMTDPIADMLTRIRNAGMAGHSQVAVPSSKMKLAIARILKETGYVRDYRLIEEKPQPVIRIWLKYMGEKPRRHMIEGLERVSKPGQRVYVGKEEIPWIRSGLGVAILSTSKGILSDRQARRLGVGGELVCRVW
ncbi:MAG: 30S ribosomal protein S8 [Chloroflexota bacterium]